MNEIYGQISQELNSEKCLLVQIAFLADVHVPFNKFRVGFLGDGPLIYVMFTKILVTIMKRFINNDEIYGKSAKA